MKLIKLVLNSDYKMLKKGLTIEFGEKNILCLIGLNGSGKSQLLTLINEIITLALEGYFFEDIYYELTLEVKKKVYKIIHMLSNGNPMFFIMLTTGKEILGMTLNQATEVLAKELKHNMNLISYSSVLSTPLSNSYYFSNLRKLHDFKQSMINGTPDYSPNLPVKFIDEKLSKILILCLFIFHKRKVNNLFEGKLYLEEIKNIKFKYQKNKYKKGNIFHELNIPLLEGKFSIENLFYQEFKDETIAELDLMKINKIRKRFEYTPDSFFNIMIALENMNLLGISKEDREYFLKNLHRLSEKVKNVYSNKHFFIEEINFFNNVEVDYLSDGEKQLLNTIGVVLLHQNSESEKETLFLFDEPTTHLNINWKSEYIDMLMQALNDGDSESQIILSTHNPELISELEKNQIVKMENGEASTIDINTFGKDKDDISMEFFNTNELLSKYVLNVYQSFYERLESANFNGHIDLIKEVKIKMAPSTDRTLLISAIKNKMEE